MELIYSSYIQFSPIFNPVCKYVSSKPRTYDLKVPNISKKLSFIDFILYAYNNILTILFVLINMLLGQGQMRSHIFLVNKNITSFSHQF